MWLLEYRECNITEWHRKYYFLKRSVINKIIALNKQHYEDIRCTSLRGSESINDWTIWKLDYKQCQITLWQTSYFATKSQAQNMVRYLEKEYWDDIVLTEVSVAKLLI